MINKRKRTCYIVDFAIPADHRVKVKESEKLGKYRNLAREIKNVVEHENDSDTLHSWGPWNGPNEPRRIGDLKKNWNHPDHSIAKIGEDD